MTRRAPELAVRDDSTRDPRASHVRSSPSVDRLVSHVLTGGAPVGLADELAGWMSSSRRFRTWVEAHRDKVRKKLRTPADASALRDVRAELAVAFTLLADRHIDLEWEAVGAQRGGPDFGISYRRTQRLNLEVTRLRRRPDAEAIASVVTGKLRQLPPSAANALVLVVDESPGEPNPAHEALRWLRLRGDRRDEAFFATRSLSGSKEFNARWRRLGGVFIWMERDNRIPVELAIQPSAHIALPPRAARAILQALAAGTGARPSQSLGV